MTPQAPDDRQAAARLLQALERLDDLACEESRELLPAFVEAELAGEDVDAAPAYAALLRHLDHCEECTSLYAGLAEDLTALADSTAALPDERPAAPPFFAATRQSEQVMLRVVRGLVRRFELALQVPRLSPARATLGGPTATLFADTLPELNGSPIVSVSLNAEGDSAELLVAIREADAATHWQVQVAVEGSVRTATTDERGIAQFKDLPLASLRQLTLSCVELPAIS
jgi:predicted anti-sigma-YlaC factor YlaD